MKQLSEFTQLKIQRLDQKLSLSPGLTKVLGLKSAIKMSRYEVMHRLLHKLHFLKLHNILGEKNYRIPETWQEHLQYTQALASEDDLLHIISQHMF